MKTILIIASFYGSKRVLGLARYLPEFGWSPTIITPPVRWQPTIISSSLPEIEGVRIIETGYGGIKEPILRAGQAMSKSSSSVVRKLASIGGAMINYPDSYSDWRRFALQAGREVLDKGDVDAVMSICPVTSHLVASQLKKEYNVFWLADFPDLWSQNVNHSYGHLRQVLDRRLEVKTLLNVDIITTASPFFIDRLQYIHSNKPVHAITLGYDPQRYSGSSTTLDAKFTITYTGTVYKGKQSPDILLSALRDLFVSGKVERDDCEVNFYTPKTKWLNDLIQNLGLGDVVHQHTPVSQDTVTRVQKASQVLLLLDWDDPKELGGYTAKVFEYLGAQRPILAVGGVTGNAIDKLLSETHAGEHALTVSDTKDTLLSYYNSYQSGGIVSYHGILTEIRKYSYQELTREFACLLDKRCVC